MTDTNRRKFLQSAAALSATPLAGRAAFATHGKAAALDAVIFDARYAESKRFAQRASLLGAPIRVIEGDITDLWRTELVERWRAAPAATAGLTERHALFLLERLAWDHGLRVVYEAEHLPAGDGLATHRVLRSADPQLAGELDAAGIEWPAAVADALVSGNRATTRNYNPTDAAMATQLHEAERLHSWVIAPRTGT